MRGAENLNSAFCIPTGYLTQLCAAKPSIQSLLEAKYICLHVWVSRTEGPSGLLKLLSTGPENKRLRAVPCTPGSCSFFAAIGHKAPQLFILSVLFQSPVLTSCWPMRSKGLCCSLVPISVPAVISGHPRLFLWGELWLAARTVTSLLSLPGTAWWHSS